MGLTAAPGRKWAKYRDAGEGRKRLVFGGHVCCPDCVSGEVKQ
jgi:hypothetical protein